MLSQRLRDGWIPVTIMKRKINPKEINEKDQKNK